MDHLCLPFGAELTEEDEVPCVSYNNYLGVPFLEYVKSNEAYRVAANMVDAGSMSLYESALEMSELERFLQTWLFFGLLQELLGDDLFDPNDFVRPATHSNTVVISTKVLPAKLRQWMMRDQGLDQQRLDHLRQCLHMTYLALFATPVAFNTKVKIAIAATAEVLSTAVILAAKAGGVPDFLVSLGCWGDFDEPSLRVAEMQKRGWCPAQAALTLEKFYSLQSKIYLSHVTKRYKGQTHDGCAIGACSTWQMDVSEYRSLHLHPGTCRDVKANQAKVIKALKDSKIALLDLKFDRKSKRFFINVVPARPNSWFVALSHVWADGLGNPKRNSLPQCQLARIYGLIRSLYKPESSNSSNQKRPYLWLDTLCCPVDPVGKLLALAQMPQVYRDASQVLALDSSLVDVHCKHLHPVEVMSRVFSSGWIFRLWTLNEANLASKLWVQFRDGPIELRQVFDGLSIMTEPETYHFTSELVSEYWKLRIESSQQDGGELWYLAEALRYRSVCKISDEPVCLAALLQIKADVVIGGGGGEVQPPSNREDRLKSLRDQRMARMWRATVQGHPKIPKSLIYHVGERLTTPGLRWAPSTLLNIKDTSHFFYSNETDLALPSSSGLLLSSAACSVSVPQRVDGMLGRPSTAASSMFDLLKCGEQWFEIFSTSDQKKYPLAHGNMALYDLIVEAGSGAKFELLLQHPINPPREPVTRMHCLLVANTLEESGVPKPKTRHVGFIRQGWISSLDEVTCGFLDTLLGQAQALQNDSIMQEIHENGKHGAQDPRYLDTIKRLLGKVEDIVTQLESALNETGQHLPENGLGLRQERRPAIFALLSRFYRNRYMVKEIDFPVTQEYCLD
jgi:hypothetical protein